MTWNKFRIVDDVSVCWCDIFRVPRSQYVRVTLAALGLGFRSVAKQRNWSTIFFPLYVAWCMRIQRRTVRVAENTSWIASAVNTKRNNITTELRSIFYFLIHNTLRILHSNSTSQRTHTHTPIRTTRFDAHFVNLHHEWQSGIYSRHLSMGKARDESMLLYFIAVYRM